MQIPGYNIVLWKTFWVIINILHQTCSLTYWYKFCCCFAPNANDFFVWFSNVLFSTQYLLNHISTSSLMMSLPVIQTTSMHIWLDMVTSHMRRSQKKKKNNPNGSISNSKARIYSEQQKSQVIYSFKSHYINKLVYNLLYSVHEWIFIRKWILFYTWHVWHGICNMQEHQIERDTRLWL